MVLLRHELGDELRRRRQSQGRTLREVSAGARVSLGYLSEVERGQKEASSELLASICDALDVPMSVLLREVADQIAAHEPVRVDPVVTPVIESAAPVIESAAPVVASASPVVESVVDATVDVTASAAAA